MTCRCKKEDQSDYVLVRSDKRTIEDHDVTSAGRLCDTNTRYPYVQPFRSESSSLYVEFRSNDVHDATGFEATYHFYSTVQGNNNNNNNNNTTICKAP